MCVEWVFCSLLMLFVLFLCVCCMGLIPRLHNNDSDDNDDLFHPGDIVVHSHYMDQHTSTYIFILPYKYNCIYTIHNGLIVEGMD